VAQPLREALSQNPHPSENEECGTRKGVRRTPGERVRHPPAPEKSKTVAEILVKRAPPARSPRNGIHAVFKATIVFMVP
jgi:hypothetical protein